MKNVQVIDGATNCTYSIYSFTDEEFQALFPEPGQDVEFIEDAYERLGDVRFEEVISNVWSRPVSKSDAHGIHGTLFYGLLFKKEYYPTKSERDVAGPPHSPARPAT